MSKDIYNVQITDLLPPNLKKNISYTCLSAGICDQLKVAIDNIPRTYPTVDNAEEWELNIMAWDRHVDFYDDTLPVEIKRELVRNSFNWHLRKGTPQVVDELTTAVFGRGECQEWFEYGGEAGYFRIFATNNLFTKADLIYFLTVLYSVKRLSAWLEEIILQSELETDLYIGSAVPVWYSRTKIPDTKGAIA